tara:strand:- start:50 stop:316 length:267 start_codon:yes stop_codon:yes gene_type:complete
MNKLVNGKLVTVSSEEESLIASEEAKVLADKAVNGYKEERTQTGSKIYAPTGEQLAMIYDDIIAGKLDATGSFAAHNKEVKDANPKPS